MTYRMMDGMTDNLSLVLPNFFQVGNGMMASLKDNVIPVKPYFYKVACSLPWVCPKPVQHPLA